MERSIIPGDYITWPWNHGVHREDPKIGKKNWEELQRELRGLLGESLLEKISKVIREVCQTWCVSIILVVILRYIYPHLMVAAESGCSANCPTPEVGQDKDRITPYRA